MAIHVVDGCAFVAPRRYCRLNCCGWMFEPDTIPPCANNQSSRLLEGEDTARIPIKSRNGK